MNIETLDRLKAVARGKIFLPRDEVYEKASQFFKRTLAPNVVLRPESAEDMAAMIHVLSKDRPPIVIKSGGHSNIVYDIPDDAVLVDLSALSSIKVIDADKGIVQVGTGTLAGEVADILDTYKLGLASGDSRVVGIGGLATGGGLGFLVRKYGALVDNIISVEVVVADGAIIEASEDRHPELFWAVRGGGSNFGIVTQVTFQAHPVKEVHEAVISYPLQNVAAVIKGWRDVMRKAPAELTSILTVLPARAEAPASIVIHGCFLGADTKTAETAYAPLAALGKPLKYAVQAMRYKDILESGPPRSTGKRAIARNVFLKTLTDDVIATIATLCEDGAPPVLQIRHVAGAMNERPADSTAFSHRDSEVLIYHGTSVAFDATDEDIAAALAAWRAIEPFGTGGYINMSSEATEAELARAFPPEALRRLRHIKKQYDPHNVFRINYNIRPESS
ncbi:MAG TPA: FAD-binding oxidoreductase [Candidatus Saccharimonadales bacterium]|nr:FAD-binding oxidoreductase [Candidatus Saccharimonadales bacterium]